MTAAQMEALVAAAREWRKWNAATGGCRIHHAPGSDMPGSCWGCTEDERVREAMFDATEPLDGEVQS